MPEHSPEKRNMLGIRWDGTINAGHVLILAGWTVAVFIWGTRLEAQVNYEKVARERFEAELTRRLERDDIRERDAFSELRTSLRRIEDFLLRAVQPPPVERRTLP